MSNLLFILKTQSLINDQRVLKEIQSIRNFGDSVEIFGASDCECKSVDIGIPYNRIKILGGAAPENLFLRILGVLQFYYKAFYFVKKNKPNKLWICDPIMFGLVLLLKIFNNNIYLIWDNHELPPDWFLKNKFLMKIYKISYLKSDCVIHCNKKRKEYLESVMKVNHKKTFIISNYPKSINFNEQNLSENVEEWIRKNNFVYLQNSLQKDRLGSEAIKTLISNGYFVLHGGIINKDYLFNESLINYVNEGKLMLAGYLSYNQINRALNKSLFTVILYKMDSKNQIYCDPNRLYQSLALGVPVVIGSNPSMVDICKDYLSKKVLDSDGSNLINLNNAISSIDCAFFNRDERKILLWSDYEIIFQKVLEIN